MALIAKHLSSDERREASRRSIDQLSTLRDRSMQPRSVKVYDLSADGCMIESDEKLAIGSSFQIGIPGVGRRLAVVVREEGVRYGCRFDEALSMAAVQKAFGPQQVIFADFGPVSPRPAITDDVVVDKWHPAVRLTFLLGATTFAWTALIKLL